mmetsp:Transcript_23469/g.54293  ORF Transcript_23469/g.54293 Transcript_23469/m.54293 type:complete len:247 (-) Transcript_23469:721-1461(-)
MSTHAYGRMCTHTRHVHSFHAQVPKLGESLRCDDRNHAEASRLRQNPSHSSKEALAASELTNGEADSPSSHGARLESAASRAAEVAPVGHLHAPHARLLVVAEHLHAHAVGVALQLHLEALQTARIPQPLPIALVARPHAFHDVDAPLVKAVARRRPLDARRVDDHLLLEDLDEHVELVDEAAQVRLAGPPQRAVPGAAQLEVEHLRERIVAHEPQLLPRRLALQHLGLVDGRARARGGGGAHLGG